MNKKNDTGTFGNYIYIFSNFFSVMSYQIDYYSKKISKER